MDNKVKEDTILVNGKYSITDLVNVEELKALLEDFSAATGFTSSLITYPEQVLLFGTGWRDICTKFHRGCGESEKHCKQSNLCLTAGLKSPHQINISHCDNGLVDGATPIIIRGKHVASLATGQVFFQGPDMARFEEQAAQYGFDLNPYLEAVRQVPIVSQERFERVLRFLGGIAVKIAELGLHNLEIRESEKKYRNIFESILDTYFETGIDGEIIDFSPSIEHLTGYSRDEIVGKSILNYWAYPELRAELIDKLVRQKTVNDYEVILVHKDGTHIPLAITANLDTDDEGKSSVIRGIIRNITDRKKAELAVRDSESLLRRVIDTSPVSLYVKDREGRYILVNKRMAQSHNTTPEALVGVTDLALAEKWLTTEAQQNEFRAAELQVIDKKQVRFIPEEEFTFKDGTKRWYQTTKAPISLSNKKECLLSVSVDITERKWAEQELHEAKQFIESIINLSPDILYIFDIIEKRNIYSNDGIQKVLGYSVAEIQDMGAELLATLLHPEDMQAYLKDIYPKYFLLDDDTPIQHQYRMRHKNGSWYWLDCIEKIYSRLPDGSPKEIFGVVHDITDRKNAADELQKHRDHLRELVDERTSELAAINQELESFSYSVSHDLRAPLRSMDGFSQIILEDYADKLDSNGKDYLNRICNSTKRMSQLIDDLLKLARLSRAEMHEESVDISQIARATTTALKKNNPDRKIKIVIQDGIMVVGDKHLLTIALSNLIGNAWKFTRFCDQASIEIGADTIAGRRTIFIKDNGAGFDMSHANKLFGAFQRLHSVTEFEGTGIGLSIVKRIINRHRGHIWAESEPQKGTTFYFTLGSTC